MFKKMKKTNIGADALSLPKNTEKCKTHAGITLNALIITIVILIILAGVTISMTLRRKWNIPKIKTSSSRIPNSK